MSEEERKAKKRAYQAEYSQRPEVKKRTRERMRALWASVTEEQRERARKRSRKYQAANRKKIRAQQVEYRAANREKVRASSQARHWRNNGVRIDHAGRAALLAAQRGLCAICGDAPNGRALHVDHDHATGHVRGLLCGRCNRALGSLGDSLGPVAAWCEAALRYLRAHLEVTA